MKHFIQNIFFSRHVIFAMARRQVAERNAGTLGGFAWEIIHPLSMVLIYWFVFAVGFRAKGPGEMPFILYFATGMLPWLTFASVLNGSTNSILANAHLVKKTIFPTEVLSIVHLLSAMVSHLILLLIVFLLLILHGYETSWAMLQLPYYFFGMALLLMGLSWLTSALNVYNRDIGQFVRVLTDIWFWLTPVVWVIEMVPEKIRWVINLNPMSFVVQGYRNSLLSIGYFWQDGWYALYFWSIVLCVLGIGTYVFRRLKSEFVDVI